MKLVYVAGPYRAKTLFELETNIRRARDLAVDVVSAGHYPVVPHLCTGFMDGLVSDRHFLDGARELLIRCDEVWLVNGWSWSIGTLQEIVLAIDHCKPILDSNDGYHAPREPRQLRRDVGRLLSQLVSEPEPAPI